MLSNAVGAENTFADGRNGSGGPHRDAPLKRWDYIAFDTMV